IRISVPSYVRVQNVDLATELQTLIYFLEHYGPTLKEPEA
ncbi:redox-sensing transcriptional repressor Rex, partial [Lacticaseibacillus paracasei]